MNMMGSKENPGHYSCLKEYTRSSLRNIYSNYLVVTLLSFQRYGIAADDAGVRSNCMNLTDMVTGALPQGFLGSEAFQSSPNGLVDPLVAYI